MPPKVRFDGAKIIDAAFEIVRQQGIDALSARAIAQAAGCSTQPLYHEIGGMESIRQAVTEKARSYFEEFICSRAEQAPLPYLGSGMAYLRFAKEESKLFQLLFMCHRTPEEQNHPGHDATFEFAARMIAKNLGYSMETARAFHLQSHVFVHGLAAMLTTGFTDWNEEEMIRLLRHQYRALRLAFDTPQETNT